MKESEFKFYEKVLILDKEGQSCVSDMDMMDVLKQILGRNKCAQIRCKDALDGDGFSQPSYSLETSYCEAIIVLAC